MRQDFENSSHASESSLLTSDPSGELSFATQCLRKTIDNEVLQGEKLRQMKLKSQTTDRSLNVFNKSPGLARNPSIAKRKSSASPCRKNNVYIRERARSNSPFVHWNYRGTRGNSLILERETLSTARTNIDTSKRRCRPVCSMRTSELAVPTKRQCIDTWRNKAKVLPGVMVNRLKEHVMDQTPIVKVSDAVNTFRCHKVSKSKSLSRKINKEGMRNRDYEETQNISAIFGHKLAQNLMKPMTVTLNSRLQNISSIIADEIFCIMKDNQKLPTDERTDQLMLREIADKVTIWISSVLGDASEKLLEEDLRVKKMQKTTLTAEEDLITLVGSMVRQEAELEEQEGPVLDILDEMVDNVVISCQGPEADESDILTPDFLSVSSENDDITEDKNTALDDTEAASPIIQGIENDTNIRVLESKFDENSLRTELVNEINEIIDSKLFDVVESNDVIQNSEFSNETNNETKRSESLIRPLPDVGADSELDIEKYDQEQHGTEINESNLTDQDDTNEQLTDRWRSEDQEQNSKDMNKNSVTGEPVTSLTKDNKEQLLLAKQSFESKLSQNEDVDSTKSENGNILPSIENIYKNNETDDVQNGAQSENVSDEFKLLLEELSEERNKKVQFSRERIDTIIGNEGVESFHRNQHLGLKSYDVKPEINFAPPNEHLLSDADEPWPDNLQSSPTLKPSASVSKSITSLGKILESDEKHLVSPDEEESLDIDLQSPKHFEQSDNTDTYKEQFSDVGYHNHSIELHTKLSVGYNDGDQTEINSLDEIDIPQQNLKGVAEIVTMEHNEEHDSKQAIDTESQREPTISIKNIELEATLLAETEIDNSTHLFDHARVVLDEQLMAAHEMSCPIYVSTMIPELQKYGETITIQKQSNSDTYGMNSGQSGISKIVENTQITKLTKYVSVTNTMTAELQKYGDKIQDIISLRELSKSDKYHTNTGQSGNSAKGEHSQKGKITCKMHQKRALTNVVLRKKFDYRVHPSTAPSWIRPGCGQGEAGEGPDKYGYSGIRTMKERELEILKWCKDLDNILLNLDKWRKRLQYITMYINILKEKAEKQGLSATTDRGRSRSQRRLEKDAMWVKLNKRAKGNLKLYRNDETINFKITKNIRSSRMSGRYCIICGCQKQVKGLPRSLTRK